MMLYGINTTLLYSDSASSSAVEDLQVGLGIYDVAGNGPFVVEFMFFIHAYNKVPLDATS